MKKHLTFSFLFLLLIIVKSNAQQNARPAATNMTLQIGGTTPSNLGGGTSFPGIMEVLAWSEGISSGCITPTGCPVPNQQDISMTMYQTSDFILLRKALLLHTPINIELVNTFAAGDVSKIYLEEAYVSSISNGGSGGEDKLTMNITFTSTKWAHFFEPGGPPIGIHYGWNFVTNSVFLHY